MHNKSIKYYKLSTGIIFKYDPNNKTFYYLDKNKTWKFYAPLLSIYLDPASDYEEISEEDVKNEITGGAKKI